MTNQPTLSETLRATSEMLKAIRKMVGDAGHLHEMHEIDTLINVAQAEADRRAGVADMVAKQR